MDMAYVRGTTIIWLYTKSKQTHLPILTVQAAKVQQTG